MQDLSDKQKRVLLKNPNVEKITDKHVVYTSKFKVKAVEAYLNGKSSNQIFSDAGIDPNFFITKYCQSCLKRWKKKYFEDGKKSFKKESRGSGSTGRPKKEDPDDLTIEELRALVEIQQDLIYHLKKKKALTKKTKR
tara:strand:+ start:290 stop:700 length:411 start_codon:yes stop_codon:yes gene_type:complete